MITPGGGRGEEDGGGSPPPPTVEAGAAANQASLAAPSANTHRGQMEARPDVTSRQMAVGGGWLGGNSEVPCPPPAIAASSKLQDAPELRARSLTCILLPENI